MNNSDDALTICNFLKQTPEAGLRKMLVDKSLTEAHFRILMKLAKGCPEAEFVDAFTKDTMGKLRLSPKEAPLKDTFWSVCLAKFVGLGLISKAAA